MDYFEVIPDEGFQLCHPKDHSNFEFIVITINGESRRSSWSPIQFDLISRDEDKKLKPSDSPWLESHALVFCDEVVSRLEPLLSKHGELLPIEVQGRQLHILNITTIINALDELRSGVTYFSDGRIMMIRTPVLDSKKLVDVDIFKIPKIRASPSFVSRNFVNAWASFGFRGLQFKPVTIS